MIYLNDLLWLKQFWKLSYFFTLQILGVLRVGLQWFTLVFRHRMTKEARKHLHIKFSSKLIENQTVDHFKIILSELR